MEKPPTKTGDSFGRWFDWVISAAEIYDYGRYPVKGMGVWTPYGFKIREKVLSILRDLLNSTGHEEILLPLLIPEDMIKKEGEHIKGFEDEVYWVTHGGLDPLDVKLALRPTSEVAITYMETLWYKSYRQLPKKLYQVVSIFRYETKATRPMLRLREVTTFKEAHTLHDSFEDADKQVREAMEIYAKFFDRLGIPYIISKRPEWDKFPGAVYTIAFDTLMPDGRALQIGTVHHLGQTFTRVFETIIHKRDGSQDYGWQTSYGISDRVVASLISIHGDDRGAIILPSIAPIQVAVIPIPSQSDEETEKIWKYAEDIERMLREAGISSIVDLDTEKKPVEKYYYYEIKGVPLRVEVGAREFRSNSATIFRRDSFKRSVVSKNELVEKVKETLENIERSIKEKAWRDFKSQVRFVNTLEEATNIIASKAGIVEIPWCGREGCAIELVEKTGASKMLGTPLEIPNLGEARCPICGGKARTIARIAKTY
ncbi:MAG: proline--tRNA ligase [Desulfurococcales archaeon]|nr:proline--tRNA ligase [Desulfurococcales archaeon]